MLNKKTTSSIIIKDKSVKASIGKKWDFNSKNLCSPEAFIFAIFYALGVWIYFIVSQ
jgi:hypothetical protein